jgi:hypothetical protein
MAAVFCTVIAEAPGRFWDNVGGDIVDAAIEHAASNARFLVRLFSLATSRLLTLQIRNAVRSRGTTPASKGLRWARIPYHDFARRSVLD